MLIGEDRDLGKSRGLWAATALFFASGATGLAYEVLWFRRFAHIWGASTLAMAAVVSSFLLGLGIGAHFLGRKADTMAVPLRGYAWCEVAIGLLALLIPFECSLLTHAAGALYPALHQLPLLYTGVRFLLTFLVIGPPCILMGGTFPLLVRQFAGSGEVGPTAGWLYAVEDYADSTIERARRILGAAFHAQTPPHPRAGDDDAAPRRRFGLAFESRPPPLPA